MFLKSKKIFLKYTNISEIRTKQVIKGSISMLLSSALSNATRLGVVFILARYYSKEEFGIWAAITSATALLTSNDFGITNALRNKLSVLRVKDDTELNEGKSYFFSAFLFFLILSLCLSLLLLTLSYFVSFDVLFKTDNTFLKSQGSKIILLVQFIVFLNIPFSMGGACFFSFNESIISSLFSAFSSVLLFILVLAFTFLHYSIVTISVGYFSINLIIGSLSTLYFIKRRGWFSNPSGIHIGYRRVKELFLTGFQFMGVQFSNAFLYNFGTLFASAFLGLKIAAEFNLVQKLYTFIIGISQSILNPIWGGYAEAAANKDWKWCLNTLRASTMITAFLFICIIILMYYFGNFFLFIIAGKGYVSNPILFILLGLTNLFIILHSTAATLQYAINKISILLLVNFIAVLIILPITKFFTISLDINGIALASSFIWFILFLIIFIRSSLIIKKQISLYKNI